MLRIQFQKGRKKVIMKINRHTDNESTWKDWCHLCGRRELHLADIWYPDNAEHGGADKKYIRICSTCGNDIVQTSGADRLPRIKI